MSCSMVTTTEATAEDGKASVWFFSFFQAEDGIRDVAVTGVQTCALPISGVEAEAGRQDSEGDAEEPRQHDTEPEDGHRDPDERPEPREAVDHRVAPHGRGHADRDAETDGHDDRRRRELDGRGETPEQIGEHRVAPDDRDSEVAADHTAHVAYVLLPEGAVESEAGADLRHLLGRRPLAQHRHGGGAREKGGKNEKKGGEPPEEGGGRGGAPEKGGPPRPPPRAAPRRSWISTRRRTP